MQQLLIPLGIILLLLGLTWSLLSKLPFGRLAGVCWIGLLYYFNFVQVPGVGAALANPDGPQPATISKHIAPKALLWFCMAAAVSWLTEMSALVQIWRWHARHYGRIHVNQWHDCDCFRLLVRHHYAI